jgi:hypothetical protein
MPATATSSASTGPRTPEGKAISSRNAIRHGLTSVSPLLPSEDPAEYNAFQSNIVTQYDPQDAEDTAVVLAYVDTLWRLRRTPVHESRLISIEIFRIQSAAKDDRALAELLSKLDPESIEVLAIERLSTNRSLLNLHRQEQRLNARLKALKPDLERIMHDSKVRYIEHLRAVAAAQNKQMRDEQNELPGNSPASLTPAKTDKASDSTARVERLLRRIA